jgi:hypothetical protein
MDEVIDEGERIAILPGDCIQSLVVLDEAELSIFLLDEEDRHSERGLGLSDVSSASSRNASISVCSVRVIG